MSTTELTEKQEYWANRNAGWRGQGEYPQLVRTLRPGTIQKNKSEHGLWFNVTPAFMGIKAFKRKHTPSFGGTRNNPKHRSIRGNMLKQLKAESWDELVRRERKYY